MFENKTRDIIFFSFISALALAYYMLIKKTMARLARIVIPGIPHHITQRGNRRQQTFFEPSDYQTYIHCMSHACKRFNVKIWAYCLMPNHIHLIAVPATQSSLAKAIGRGHEEYTRYINYKMEWKGYLWQGRFASFPMDEAHCLNATRYIELNPVHANIVTNPADYPWSSARSHLSNTTDPLLDTHPLLNSTKEWQIFLQASIKKDDIALIEQHQRTGRPLGSLQFIKQLELITGRILLPQKPSPKPQGDSSVSPE